MQAFKKLIISVHKVNVKRKLMKFAKPYKLHLGCGAMKFEGWINIDANSKLNSVDIVWDLSKGIPVADDSCELIYCEHLLEHLTVEKGIFFLRECLRVLQYGGILRIAMPSLDYIIEKVCQGDWHDQDWLTWPQHSFIQTKAEMLNIAFRCWGHKWLYDKEELYRRLEEAGFKNISDCKWGESSSPELRKRESRKDSQLICEAIK